MVKPVTWKDYVYALPQAVASPTLNGFKYCFSKPVATALEVMKYFDWMPSQATKFLEDLGRTNALMNGVVIFSKAQELYTAFYQRPTVLVQESRIVGSNLDFKPLQEKASLCFTVWDFLNYLRDAKIVTYSPSLEYRIDWFGTITGGTNAVLGLYGNLQRVQSYAAIGHEEVTHKQMAELALSVASNVSAIALAALFSPLVGKESYKAAKLAAKVGLFGALFINIAWKAIDSTATEIKNQKKT